MGADPAVRVSVPEEWAEIVGAVLVDVLGPFQELDEGGRRHMIFYPFRHGAGFVEDEQIIAQLPDDPSLLESVSIERLLVPAGWEEGWKDHFKPITIGRLYIRPPWEEPPPSPDSDTQGVSPPRLGPLRPRVLSGPPSMGISWMWCSPRGLLSAPGSIPPREGSCPSCRMNHRRAPWWTWVPAPASLRSARPSSVSSPVVAFDNDPLAVTAARSNAAGNRVDVRAELTGLEEAPPAWFDGATILANLTLEPVLALLSRLEGAGVVFRRLLVSGILAGEQETAVAAEAARLGLVVGRRVHETEWVSMELRPTDPRADLGPQA